MSAQYLLHKMLIGWSRLGSARGSCTVSLCARGQGLCGQLPEIAAARRSAAQPGSAGSSSPGSLATVSHPRAYAAGGLAGDHRVPGSARAPPTQLHRKRLPARRVAGRRRHLRCGNESVPERVRPGGLARGADRRHGRRLATANRLAPAQTGGQVLSTYFVFAYVGVTVPVIAVGFGSRASGDFRATLVCAIALAAIALASMAVIRRSVA
jgi:hypothetical protein